MYERIINVNIYRRSVVVLQGTEDELEKWFSEHDLKHLTSSVTSMDWENTRAITFDDDIDIYICSVEPMDLSVLCHEFSHATLRILRIVGIDPINAEEAYAYLFEFLITQVTSSLDGVLLQLSQDVSSHIAQSQSDPS